MNETKIWECAKNLFNALKPLTEAASGLDMYRGDPKNIEINVTDDELFRAWSAALEFARLQDERQHRE
jgi:hypothetical protein